MDSRSWHFTKPLSRIIWRWRQIMGESHLPETESRDDYLTVPSVPQSVGSADSKAPNTNAHILEIGRRRNQTEQYLQGLRVVIVTPDIHGPIRNGGIGTAFSTLAQKIVTWGADITIAYVLGEHSESEPISYWQKYYANLGVRFLALDDSQLPPVPSVGAPYVRRLSWRVYRWLDRNVNEFDIAIFPDWWGLSYYSVVAKGQGISFKNLYIAVNSHGPSSWGMEGNRALPDRLDLVEIDFMERECVRRADWVISPSNYLFDWMKNHKWKVSDRIRVIQNLMADSADITAGDVQLEKPTILVFFGRLEPRKGLKLFCEAIDRLSPEQRKGLVTIRFLGKAVSQPDGFDSLRYIADRTSHWGVPIDITTDKNKDEALTELSKPGVLAIIASLSENSPYTVLECLHYGVHFIASRVGGIPELVNSSDAESCLFEPNPPALARCLEKVIMNGSVMARVAQPQSRTIELWKDWFFEVTKMAAKTSMPAGGTARASLETPLVSICLVHYNRPECLVRALASIKEQSYPNIEVVLVDDGSPSVEARKLLGKLEVEFREQGWQLIRQVNSYPGVARNRAASAARGQYLLFMDDDNVAMPHEIETFVCAAIHSGADILTCPSATFTDQPPESPSHIWLPLGGSAGAGIFKNVFGDNNAFWKRSAYLALGGYTTDYGVGHEDWELFAEAVLSGYHLEVVPIPLFWYRVNVDGIQNGGDTWANYARSARAYLRHDTNGLGMASAYAVFSQMAREHDAHRPAMEMSKRRRRLWRALRMAGDPSLRVQFFNVWRHQGFRAALNRALEKANRYR